jgi:type I restriction enzyme, S subunit
MASQPLGEIADIVRGISFPKDAKSLVPRDGDVACLRTTNVQREVEWDDLWFVPTEHVKRPEQFVQAGDILISTANSYELVGKVALVSAIPRKATLGAFISLIRPRLRVDPKYLYHQLAWGRTQARIRETASTTTNISNVSSKKLAALKLDLPPLDEQRRIVAELDKRFSRLDEAVATLQRAVIGMSAYRASVLEAAIRGQLVGESATKHVLRLDQLIGPIHQGWSPKCDLQREPGPDEWAVVTTTAVQPMMYVDNQGKPLPAELEPRPRLEIQPGDFLVTRKGPRTRAGVACLVRRTRRRLMVCDTVYRFRCDDSKVVPAYLEIALNAPSVVQAIDRQKAGINESGVSLTHEKLGGIRIPVPVREVQHRIVGQVDRSLSIVREVEAEVDANLKRATRLRQAVLARAFG